MSCTDVQTIQAGNGTKTQFSFDFPYIFKSEIHVYFWNATTKEWDEKLTTDATYPWQVTDANPTIVEFTSTAPPSPATPVDPGEPTVDNVRIRRITNIDDIRALFNPGSAIRSDDLNNNFEQLRYAIQESNCPGVPDDVQEYLEEYYWDRYDNTLYAADTWVSNDTKIATTAALDARFQDEATETLTKAELASASDVMPDNDDAVPTTGATKDYIDHVIETDILVDSTGLNKTGSGGQVTIGISAGSVDLDRIKAEDIITYAEQEAGPTTDDDSIFTSNAAARRFDTIVQTDTPSGSNWETGKTWLQNDDDLTLSIWNGSSWSAVTSGGTFTNQPTVVYVDATAGDDNNNGHRISRPKRTIAAAITQINADTDNGDGSVVVVAPGIYAETFPIDIERNDVGIIGVSLRTCIVHPAIPTADQAGYDVDVPEPNELRTMFRCNSGSYFQNLTLTGMKASGARGGTGSLYEDTTYGLPVNQGWNFGFLPGATIRKSPYIQNCTNFSDSQINNVTFTPHTPGEGAAGDNDSAPTGGGILVDGSVPADTSPLRSMVCDSYTHTALDGPGILVTNNGYMQATSSYAFFNHAHITCINGGQANLAASTTDFGRYGLVADGRSPNAIFTSNVDGAANSGATTFNINAPTASTDLYAEAGTENDNDWFGSATRPQSNMLVEVNSVTYPVLSATANTDSEGNAGWTVTISRPDPSNRSNNLGLNGALTDDAAVSFFLRSQIASSGHTMEYVGSGTNYTALPENGGVPDENDQKIELNNGKIWAATTDHNGKFTLGGNQTDDPFFEVDQQAGFVTIPEGSIAFNLLSDETPQLGGNLDVQARTITTSTTNGNITLDPNGTGVVDVSTSRITNVTDPTGAQDAATKNYVDTQIGGIDEVVEDLTPQLGGDLDVNGQTITSASNGNIVIDPNGTGIISLGSNVGVGNSNPGSFYANADDLVVGTGSGHNGISIYAGTTSEASICFADGTSSSAPYIGRILYEHNTNSLSFDTGAQQRMIINSSGRVGIGVSSPEELLHLSSASPKIKLTDTGTGADHFLDGDSGVGTFWVKVDDNAEGSNPAFIVDVGGTERLRINSSGSVGIGTTPDSAFHLRGTSAKFEADSNSAQFFITPDATPSGGVNLSVSYGGSGSYGPLNFTTGGSTSATIDSSGRLLVGKTSASGTALLQIEGGVSSVERTITASAFDLGTGNFWTCGAIAIPNPTNGVAGMSGLIRVTAAPTSFGSNWDFPGGSYTAPTAFPAVAPFYIVSSTQFYLGNWTEGIA